MAFSFTTGKPCTVHIKNVTGIIRINVFKQGLPLSYFFRVLNKKFDTLKFNICHAGTYHCEVGTIVKITGIEITPLSVILPAPDRNRFKEFKIIYNPNLDGTPARNFTGRGIIETGNTFKNHTFAVRVFILLHEVGHFFYKDETLCDLFAAKVFIDLGYNNSTAFYALSQVLNCNSDRNKKRVLILFNNLNK